MQSSYHNGGRVAGSNPRARAPPVDVPDDVEYGPQARQDQLRRRHPALRGLWVHHRRVFMVELLVAGIIS